MKILITVVLFLASCGGKPAPAVPPGPKPDNCTAANKVAVEQGVEIERDENSALYTTLTDADIDCARRAVRSSAPLAVDAPACLHEGRTLTAWVAALLANDKAAELPADAARTAFTAEVGAVPEAQRPAYLLEALDRAYNCGGEDLALDENFWAFLGEIEFSIEACKCTLDTPRLQLLAWYFHAGGGDWAAAVAERRGP
jgi:hypothetical protein